MAIVVNKLFYSNRKSHTFAALETLDSFIHKMKPK